LVIISRGFTCLQAVIYPNSALESIVKQFSLIEVNALIIISNRHLEIHDSSIMQILLHNVGDVNTMRCCIILDVVDRLLVR